MVINRQINFTVLGFKKVKGKQVMKCKFVGSHTTNDMFVDLEVGDSVLFNHNIKLSAINYLKVLLGMADAR